MVDVRAETAAILWVQLKDLPQSLNADVLQVTVGQCLHICIDLDHLVIFWEVSPDEVPFTCAECVKLH